MQEIIAKEMRLADTVRMVAEFGPFSTCVVKRIESDVVTLFRPYVHTADFESTGGVICYVGIEEYNIPRDSATPYFLLASKALK